MMKGTLRRLETQSWQAAYFAAVGATLFSAIVSFFYPVWEPVMIAVKASITGPGAYQATFYFTYRRS